MSTASTRAVFPGSFDPLTVAHVAIADAVRAAHDVAVVDLVISRVALAKDPMEQSAVDDRLAAIRSRTTDRPWMRAMATDAQLLVDIAEGYDLLVVGADKWLQIHDAGFYGGDPVARDAAVARLPALAVVPRGDVVLPSETAPHLLRIDDDLRHVSSTAVRRGLHAWRA